MAGGEGGAQATAGRGSELGLRIASSLVLGLVALGATWAGGWAFGLLWLVAGIALAAEWTAMADTRPRAILIGIATFGLAALLLAREGGGTALLAVSVACLAATLVVGRSSRDRSWAASGFVCAAVVTLVPVLVRDRPDLGAWGIGWMFAVVWTTDIAAFFVGRALGGPKLMPRVSPKKTWSGFVGGLVGGTAAGATVAYLARRSGLVLPAGLIVLAVAAALASVVSQAGDLAESAMKRFFGVKDSGRLIPGHGGVMDRLDGFAAVSLLVGLALAGSRFAGAGSSAAP